MKKFSIKQISIGLVILAVLVLIAGAIFITVKADKAIKAAEAKAISKIDFNTGTGRGQAYLYPTSTVSSTPAPANSCGAAAGDNISVGNYQLMVVKKFLGINVAYRFDLPDMTFVSGKDKIWNGQLHSVNLDLTGVKSDKFALYQYEDCDHAVAYLFDINPNTNRLEPIQFRGADNQVNYVVATRSDFTFKATGKDKMDTKVDSGNPGKPYDLVHWQFDSKNNLFKQTGKDLTAAK